MPQKFYVGNYGGPLSVNVFAADGETPILPLSATIDIIDMVTGAPIISGGTCLVASGSAYYVIPSGSAATSTTGRYAGFITVLIETGNEQTEEVYYNVYSKSSTYLLERWRAKVEDSAPDQDHIDDDAAREWIDQAVGYLGYRIGSGYSSILGTVTPQPTSNDIEFISSVASLLARTMWWAGKGDWHDAELSFSSSPFRKEWDALEEQISFITAEDWYGDFSSGDMFNRDRVYYDGKKYDSPSYWQRQSTDPVPSTDIPI